MAKIKKNRYCRGCGKILTTEKAWRKVCDECRGLIAVGSTEDIVEFERLRKNFNCTHKTLYTYGRFTEYIEHLKERVKG